MRYRSLIFGIYFLVSAAFFYAQDNGNNTIWFGYDGILEQRLPGGATVQMEVVHTIVNASNLSIWEIETLRKAEIDEAYANFLNRWLSIYTTGERSGDFAWYRYTNGKNASVQLRRPFNRMNIIVIVNLHDIETKSFGNMSVWFNFVDKSGREYRRLLQELNGLASYNFGKASILIDRCMREVGAYIPPDGTGMPVYNLDNIIQRPSAATPRTVEPYNIDGLMPDYIPPSAPK